MGLLLEKQTATQSKASPLPSSHFDALVSATQEHDAHFPKHAAVTVTASKRIELATSSALLAADAARIAFFLSRRPSMVSASRRVKFRA